MWEWLQSLGIRGHDVLLVAFVVLYVGFFIHAANELGRRR